MNQDNDLLTYERKGRIALITLNRPPVNALSEALYGAIVQRIEQLNQDQGIHVAILTGAGRKAFCAGADVKEMRELDATSRRARHEFVSSVWVALANAAVPIIAAINGPSPGGGTVIAGLCDYRIAAEEATFSYPEIDRGTAGGGGVFMRNMGIPEGTIRNLLYTGRVCSAREALELGLIEKVVPQDQLIPAAMEQAQAIAVKARSALVLMKKAILAASAHSDWEAAYRATHHLSAQMTGTKEAKEGMDAFLEKRTADYSKAADSATASGVFPRQDNCPGGIANF